MKFEICHVGIKNRNFEGDRSIDISEYSSYKKVSEFVFYEDETSVVMHLPSGEWKEFQIEDFLQEYGDWYILYEKSS